MLPFAPRFQSEEAEDDFSAASVLQRCKRRIAELEEQVRLAKGAKKPVSSVKTFTNLGRCICKVVSTFDSIESLFAESDRRLDLAEARSVAEGVLDEEEPPTPEQDHLYQGYKELIRFIPPLRAALLEADHEELTELIAAMRGGARNARSDDTKNIKAAIVPWLKKFYPNMDPPLDPDSRDNRGLYHDILGALICPPEYDFSDEEVRTNIHEGHQDFPITAHSWFLGLYPKGQYDPDNEDKGLFMNVILLMVYKFIFTSPLSVKTMAAEDVENLAPITNTTQRKKKKKVTRKSKRNVAAIIGLPRVTGRSIAYAAVQYRIALSDTHQWDEKDGAFDYIQFYYNVVQWFETPPGPIAKREVDRLLDWWNTNVFGSTPQWGLYDSEAGPASSSVARTIARRAARELGA